MSDLQWLFLVLAVFYLWECACWLRRGTAALVTGFGKKWRLGFPSKLFGNQRGGFVFANPLPPLGVIVTTSDFALSLSPEVAFAYMAANPGPGWRPPHTGAFARYEDLRDVGVRGKMLMVNGRNWVRFANPAGANQYAALLRQLAKLSRDERAKAVREFIASALDEREVTRRWKEFQSRTRQLRWLCNALVLYLFAAAPVVIWDMGLQSSWLPLLLGLFSLSFCAAYIFHSLHRNWFPEQKDERFSHTLITALAPASGARALDQLSRPWLEKFHPLAAAKVFLADEEFQSFARRALLDLRHPALPVNPTTDAGAVSAELFMRGEILRAVEKFLRRHGLDAEKLCAAPELADDSCRAYCPRCHEQFAAKDAVCADCGGMPVRAFESSKFKV